MHFTTIIKFVETFLTFEKSYKKSYKKLLQGTLLKSHASHLQIFLLELLLTLQRPGGQFEPPTPGVFRKMYIPERG